MSKKPKNQTSIFSKNEKSVQAFLDSLGIKYIPNIKTIIPPQELDIYIPDYNLAIEMDGLYWHSNNTKPKNYHLEKTKKCNKRGIKLIHILDCEWKNKKEICQSIIKYNLQLTNKIPARKCKISEVNKPEYIDFCENNHIQGYAPTYIRLGLFYNNELVQVCGFNKEKSCSF